MYIAYFHWQYVVAPRWLLQLGVNLQRVWWRQFSVPVMLRTLLAHWHRDAVSYRAGSLEGIALAWAWNMISRAVGLCVRLAMILLWVVVSASTLAASLLALVLFLVAPLAIITAWAAGLAIIGGL